MGPECLALAGEGDVAVGLPLEQLREHGLQVAVVVLPSQAVLLGEHVAAGAAGRRVARAGALLLQHRRVRGRQRPTRRPRVLVLLQQAALPVLRRRQGRRDARHRYGLLSLRSRG